MKPVALMCVALALVAITGCNESAHSGGHSGPPPAPPQEIDNFALVDSYGVDSGVSRDVPLELDPYLYDGIFEIYWDVTRGGGYDFFLSVSPTADINNSVTVYSEYCGPGEICGVSGYAICQYTADFTLGCSDQAAMDVYDVFYEVPQTLHFFAETCGIDGCAYRRLPVTMF
ncbi:hypothetical protein QWI17_03830 [Gilvimarinus sp. SDUM040013]|uniref:Lipoprotein n=1 Tax=Gilvimarinus gilvus TaxID=3058038 RepID=A0ABU4S3I0_9GAMM|nr:hypothetical protein [Gilvimarinus sp. SDUM040013]MDO3384968.1 hypothetical protein [Gilvimarinus sp. SDUM040013]MDX6851494.1 hypothetical protein [Gilvimarinus sp. SDUM040013]